MRPQPRLGDELPHVTLPDPLGTVTDVAGVGRTLVVLFLCNHCPYVKHIASCLGQLAAGWEACGAGVVAINPNARTHPGDSPSRMLEFAAQHGWTFPYLVDADQVAAQAFGAVRTPDVYVYADRRLVYRGEFDGTRPDAAGLAADGSTLDGVVRAALVGDPIDQRQRPAAGCSIKWLP